MGIALYVVGAPGVGKTTLVRALLGIGPHGELPLGSYYIQKPKWTVMPKACAAGLYRGEMFDGADTIPAPKYQEALDYWAKDLAPRMPLTVLDGDRFSHANALNFVKQHALVAVVHLDAPDEVHAARRAERGSKQDANWVKGRVTKASRFVDLAKAGGAAIIKLNAAIDVPTLVQAVRLAPGLGPSIPA